MIGADHIPNCIDITDIWLVFTWYRISAEICGIAHHQIRAVLRGPSSPGVAPNSCSISLYFLWWSCCWMRRSSRPSSGLGTPAQQLCLLTLRSSISPSSLVVFVYPTREMKERPVAEPEVSKSSGSFWKRWRSDSHFPLEHLNLRLEAVWSNFKTLLRGRRSDTFGKTEVSNADGLLECYVNRNKKRGNV